MTARTVRVLAAEDRLRRRGVTQREAEVLQLLVQPQTNATIAIRLGISKRTVECHVSALMRKFAVADRASLIRAGAPALRAGLGRMRAAAAPRRPLPEALAGAMDSRRRLDSWQQRVAVSVVLCTQRESIRLHDLAAVHLDTLADDWEQRAWRATDSATRANHLRSAETARRRAVAARRRAARERQRLQAKGSD